MRDDPLTLTITNMTNAGRNCKVELDGKDISQWCWAVEFETSADGINRANLSVYVDKVIVDAKVFPTFEVTESSAKFLKSLGWTPPDGMA